MPQLRFTEEELMRSHDYAQPQIEAGQRLRLSLPGGGGYGDPQDRTREDIATDIASGLISPEEARDTYGYSGDEE